MKVKEIGNLTTDPNYGEKGDVKYCNFNVAINNPFNKEDTEFVNVSTFGKQAEACRDNLKKGSQICVEGIIKADAYLSNNGEPKASLNIKSNEVLFLGKSFNKERNQEQNKDGYSQIDDALRRTGENHASRQQNPDNLIER
jgi:single-strand DNA-binding protein